MYLCCVARVRRFCRAALLYFVCLALHRYRSIGPPWWTICFSERPGCPLCWLCGSPFPAVALESYDEVDVSEAFCKGRWFVPECFGSFADADESSVHLRLTCHDSMYVFLADTVACKISIGDCYHKPII